MASNRSLRKLLLAPEKTNEYEMLYQEIEKFVHGELLNHPLLQQDQERISVLLAGSTSIGILDDKSDVDLLILCADETYSGIVSRFTEKGLIPENSEFFVDFRLPCGKMGHVTLQKRSAVETKLEANDLEWLWTASAALILHDSLNVSQLLNKYIPLRAEVVHSLRKKTYIQLRNYAKSLDNPVNRGDRYGILFFGVAVLKEALRCSIAVEGYPYPYDKWLVQVASQLTVGSKITKIAEPFFEYLKDQSTFEAMYQEDNVLVKMEKQMRKVLVEEMRSRGVNEPWLVEWWKYVEK